MKLGDLLAHIQSRSLLTLESHATTPHSSPDMLTPCAAEIEAERRINKIKHPSPPDLNKDADPDSGHGSPIGGSGSDAHTSTVTPYSSSGDLVKDKVSLHMRSATSPESQLSYGIAKRADEKELGNTIDAFEIKGGPADVTSYHDFYRLKIAFQNIWTEIFDGQIAQLGKELYQYCVIRGWTFYVEDDPPKISTADELRDFVYRTNRMIELTVGNDSRFGKVKLLISTWATPPSDISLKEWSNLDDTTKDTLYLIALHSYPLDQNLEPPEDTRRKDAQAAVTIIKNAKRVPSRLERLLDDLDKLLDDGIYNFKVFAPNSINFGVLTTYRQIWEPLNYQVGNLVSTIPLAPQEIQRYTKKLVERKKRSTKELDTALQIRKKESSETSRVDAEIVRKALNKNDFKATADESMTIGIATIRANQAIGKDESQESSDIKKEFRENVLKATEEYKQEHQIEINTDESMETETTTFHELRNPNDELPVTYLFYELQRTYQISEKIHKLTPVILVANEVPAPNEINESWLIKNSWILKRVLLDDSFKPALEYVSKSFVGAEMVLEILRLNLEKQMQIVEQIGQQVNTKNQAISIAQTAFDSAIERYKNAQSAADGRNPVQTFFDPANIIAKFGGEEKKDYEAYRMSIASAQETLDRTQKEAEQLRSQLQTEMSALQLASDNYGAAVTEHFNHQLEIDRLRVHIKDNILHYMQAIWNHEPPDQRFFRLFNHPVPIIKASSSSTIGVTGGDRTVHSAITRAASSLSSRKYYSEAEVSFPTSSEVSVEMKTLADVADLENLLGFKGNYMIFPMKENNLLTYYMMQDYLNVDEIVTVRDPDEYGNYTIDELQAFMNCLYKKDPKRFKEHEKSFKDIIIRRLSSPIKEKDIVIIPTNSLYIEALPGKHPLLEDFKLVHRALDVKKVQAEVRHAELENVRLASRALKGKDEDPDIEKKIIIEGDSKVVAPP